jgi:hypothetical protein
VKTLIGHEYEVRIEDFERGTIDGWFRAKYLTPHAKQEGWLWEIDDPCFVRLKLEEVNIIEVRPVCQKQDAAQERKEGCGDE